MSCLWMCLSLLCVCSVFLQSSASSKRVVSNPGVSLKCNKTVEVVAGETVTLYCTIQYTMGQDCNGINYRWSNTHGNIPCNSDLKYSCEWDNLTYVSLIISNAMEEENYTFSVRTDCGRAESSAIKVQVKQRSNSSHSKSTSIPDLEPAKPHLTPAVLGVFTTLLVFGLLFFLFQTHRGREVLKRRLKTQEDPSNMDTAPGSDCLINSEICV